MRCDLAKPAACHVICALLSKHFPFIDMTYNILCGSSQAAHFTINYFCDLLQLCLSVFIPHYFIMRKEVKDSLFYIAHSD